MNSYKIQVRRNVLLTWSFSVDSSVTASVTAVVSASTFTAFLLRLETRSTCCCLGFLLACIDTSLFWPSLELELIPALSFPNGNELPSSLDLNTCQELRLRIPPLRSSCEEAEIAASILASGCAAVAGILETKACCSSNADAGILKTQRSKNLFRH
jgi:hypothetical protein